MRKASESQSAASTARGRILSVTEDGCSICILSIDRTSHGISGSKQRAHNLDQIQKLVFSHLKCEMPSRYPAIHLVNDIQPACHSASMLCSSEKGTYLDHIRIVVLDELSLHLYHSRSASHQGHKKQSLKTLTTCRGEKSAFRGPFSVSKYDG